MSQIRHTAVAVFDDPRDADRAIWRLREQGFDEGQIGYMTQTDEATTATEQGTAPTSGSLARGAGVGMLVGASLGGLAVATGTLPVAAAAGGLIAGLLQGGVVGGLLGALIRLGVPEAEAQFYQRELEAGRTVVTVNSDERYDEAVATLKGDGGRVGDSPMSHAGPGVLP